MVQLCTDSTELSSANFILFQALSVELDAAKVNAEK